jgi:hypothetical protein
MRLSPPVAASRRRLCFSISVADVVSAVAGDLGGPAQRGCDDPIVDDHDAEVVARREGLEEDALGHARGRLDRGPHLPLFADVHGDTESLLATRRLDHDLLVLRKERLLLRSIPGEGLRRDAHPRLREDLAGDALVVAAAHRDRAGQLRERLAAQDAAPPRVSAK